MAQINIRIDDDLKEKGEALFHSLGLTFSSAVSMFVSQAVKEGGIPFSITNNIEDKKVRNIIDLYNNMMLGESSYTPGSLDDELYEEAKKVCKDEKTVSVSYLQKVMKIGFNKASRIIDRMEYEGFIDPGYENMARKINKTE